ncbi:MAG: hypothetical protein HY067_01690 [Betaproteobacteria bacterium]|nr:hypothetical protein [Betaproteobacteria bacterium]
MTTTRGISGGVVLLLAVMVADCATPKKVAEPVVEKDISRVITLSDGTTCVEPAGLAETRQSPAAVQLTELFESDAKADEALTKAKEFKLKHEDVEAVYFDACRAYSNAAIKKEAFEKDRRIYLELRRQLVAQGVKEWQDKKEGIADPGKLCLVTLPDTDPDHRSFTRVIPANSSVNDCAQLASKSGSSEILLGCTKGHWENTWAKRPIAVGPTGTKTRNLSVKGSSYAPDPDCGWN